MSDDVLEVAQTTEIAETEKPEETELVSPAVARADYVADGQDHIERMRTIMLGFIDDPRNAALDADALLAEVLRSVTDALTRRRWELEAEPADAAGWDTERLRQVVRRSRELVDLLAQAL